MVIGEKRKFLSVFVTLKCLVDGSGNPQDQLTPEVIEFLGDQGTFDSFVFYFRATCTSTLV